LVPPGAGLFFKNFKKNMMERKPVVFKSPDLSKLKEVIIDHRTRIYISHDADVEEARTRYLAIKNRKY
jgi:hypothetical protein